MVDGRVARRPCGGHRFLNLKSDLIGGILDKLKTERGPLVESGDRWLGRSGSGM
jgi:hypothetical protein